LARSSSWHPQNPQSHLVTRKTHLVVKDGDSFCRGGGRIKRELAKVLLDEIVRTRVQRREEGASGMECEECQRLWKAYQRATIESVQLDQEVRSMTEDESLQKFSEVTTRAEAAEQLRVEARQKLAEHQAATGHR
jgi:hypothetical protein